MASKFSIIGITYPQSSNKKFSILEPQKKFQVIEPNTNSAVNNSRKKFQISSQTTSSNIRKNFTPITEVSGSGFHKQLNSHDCGPCLILNILNHYGIESAYPDVASIRSRLGTTANRWLATHQVSDILREHGFSSSPCEPENLRSISGTAIEEHLKRKLQSGHSVISTSGSHFRAIINFDGQYYTVLDSFNNAPSKWTPQQLIQEMNQLRSYGDVVGRLFFIKPPNK